MKVSKLKKDHLYLCIFRSGAHLDLIRYANTGTHWDSLHEFTLVVGFRDRSNHNRGGEYYLSPKSIHNQVVPINPLLEEYLNFFYLKRSNNA